MSEIVKNEIQQGIDLDGETEEFAFDLNEFSRLRTEPLFTLKALTDSWML